eukprot:CAMPEP_0114975362 /NCGR_PEP_ID=MMETSP0216-20121206/2053_1 /TAXON_ID=223996 /ORGANISM="Protocruzia adherens, Strain Boccale" /LENGTH=200 /DNA_ID=CAMNT_0002336127 /DNA_START=34 /DNA_END=636 /DNA_ORIENTATION=+
MAQTIDLKLNQELQLLKGVDGDLYEEIISLALEFLKNNLKEKKIEKAAKALGAEVETFRSALEALAWIFYELNRVKATDTEFEQNLNPFELDNTIKQNIYEAYTQNQEDIRDIINGLDSSNETRLKDFDWRLDMDIASRTRKEIFEPKYLLKLELKQGSEERTQFLEADHATLKFMTKELEQAISALNKPYARKVKKWIK